MLLRLLRYGRPHVGVLVAAFVCMAVLGVGTGVYAYLMGPALRFLLSGGTEGFGGSHAVPWLSKLPREAALWAFPVVVILVGLVRGAGYLGQFYFMGLFAQQVVKDLRREFFLRLTALSPSQLSKERVGDLLSRFSTDMTAVEWAAMYTVGSYLRDSLQVVVLAGVALSMSPLLRRADAGGDPTGGAARLAAHARRRCGGRGRGSPSSASSRGSSTRGWAACGPSRPSTGRRRSWLASRRTRRLMRRRWSARPGREARCRG